MFSFITKAICLAAIIVSGTLAIDEPATSTFAKVELIGLYDNYIVYDTNSASGFLSESSQSYIYRAIPFAIKVTTPFPEVSQRIPVDLVCVLDVSGSMSGEKIDLLRKTMLAMLDFMGANDRLTIVSFSSDAQVLANGLKIGDNNEGLKYIINSLEANGGTNISSGLQKALSYFREQSSGSASEYTQAIFLLSDGQNNIGDIRQFLQDNIANNSDDKFVIHTFGYGYDHDEDLMRDIANSRQGTFYYVERLSQVIEYFADALGGLATVAIKQLQIQINVAGLQIFENYGPDWIGKDSLNLKQLIGGLTKYYVFSVKGISSSDTPTIEVNIDQEDVQGNKAKGKIVLELQGELYNDQPKNPIVYQQYLRAEGANILKEAVTLGDSQQYDKCQSTISTFLDQVNQVDSAKQIPEIILLKSSLQDTQSNCTPAQYEQQRKNIVTQSFSYATQSTSNYLAAPADASLAAAAKGSGSSAFGNTYQQDLVEQAQAISAAAAP